MLGLFSSALILGSILYIAYANFHSKWVHFSYFEEDRKGLQKLNFFFYLKLDAVIDNDYATKFVVPVYIYDPSECAQIKHTS